MAQLSYTDPITPQPRTHFSTRLPFMPCFSGRVQPCVCLYLACYMPCQSHAHWSDMPIVYLHVSLRVGLRNHAAAHYARLRPRVTASLSRLNILLRTPQSSSSHNLSDQVSHPYQRLRRIGVLPILIVTLLHSKRHDVRP